MNFLLRLVFGCLHSRISFPFTPVRKGFRGQTYVVCLDCGREFQYDWKTFSMGEEIPAVCGSRKAAIPAVDTAVGPARRAGR
jgi:hypothetical protein